MNTESIQGSGTGRFRALIVGAGDTGLEVARRLSAGWNVTLVDISRDRLDAVQEEEGRSPAMYRLVCGDGTSRLVLEEAGADAADVAIVVSSPDTVALETCRVLRREYPRLRVVALARQVRNVALFQELGVDVLADSEAEAAALMARVDRGNRVAQAVGLGHGEVMETEVMDASSAVGKPLNAYHARNWLVAAVYRDSKLVVPHGDTVLQSGDRLLLVGDPRVLPWVATMLRSGFSEFPLHFGSGIGVALFPGVEALGTEVEYLSRHSASEFIVTLALEDKKAKGLVPVRRWEAPASQIELGIGCRKWPACVDLGEERLDLGLVVMPNQKLSWFRRMGWGETALTRQIRKSGVPVLVARGRGEYSRVVFGANGVRLEGGVATLALDVARRFALPLTLVTATPPEIVTGPGYQEALDSLCQGLRDLATPYRMRFERIAPAGNPVAGVLSVLKPDDLLVLGLPTTGRNTLTSPSVPMHLIHRAPCSVLVLPHADTVA